MVLLTFTKIEWIIICGFIIKAPYLRYLFHRIHAALEERTSIEPITIPFTFSEATGLSHFLDKE